MSYNANILRRAAQRLEQERRDRQDAPQLEQLPPDGVTLDTTGLSFDQVVQRLTGMAQERMDRKTEGEEG